MSNRAFEKGDLILDDSQLFQEFLTGLRSNATRSNYRRWINAILVDPPRFLSLARQNRWQAQQLMIDWILRRREEIEASTMKAMLATVKSLVEYAEIELSWKKIMKLTKKPYTVGRDKAPPFEKVQQMYETSDIRWKWVLGLFMSGIRVGGI